MRWRIPSPLHRAEVAPAVMPSNRVHGPLQDSYACNNNHCALKWWQLSRTTSWAQFFKTNWEFILCVQLNPGHWNFWNLSARTSVPPDVYLNPHSPWLTCILSKFVTATAGSSCKWGDNEFGLSLQCFCVATLWQRETFDFNSSLKNSRLPKQKRCHLYIGHVLLT